MRAATTVQVVEVDDDIVGASGPPTTANSNREHLFDAALSVVRWVWRGFASPSDGGSWMASTLHVAMTAEERRGHFVIGTPTRRHYRWSHSISAEVDEHSSLASSSLHRRMQVQPLAVPTQTPFARSSQGPLTHRWSVKPSRVAYASA